MQVIFEAFLLGLVGGIVPGSILTVLLVSVLQGGFKQGLRAFYWSVAAEITIVSILLLTLLNLPLHQNVFNYLGFVGAIVLFYFASQVLKISHIDKPEETEQVFTAKEIYLLAATNAPLYIFWITVCAPLIWVLANDFNLYLSATYFMLAFETGWVLSTFIVMLIFVKSRSVLTDTGVMKKVFVGVALFMGLLGAKLLYTSVLSIDIF